MSVVIDSNILQLNDCNYTQCIHDILADFPQLNSVIQGAKLEDPNSVIDTCILNCTNLIDEHYMVYAHILPDNTAYIGMTGKDLVTRSCKDGNAYRSDRPEFYAAVQKFGGWSNIKHVVLVQGLTFNKALQLESLFSRLFECAGYTLYNLRCGSKGHTFTKDVRDEIDMRNNDYSQPRNILSDEEIALFEKAHPDMYKAFSSVNKHYRRTLSAESKHKLSIKMKERHSTPEWKAKISAIHKGKIPSNAIKITALMPDSSVLEFDSATACGRYFNRTGEWALIHCRSGKPVAEGFTLRFKEGDQ